MKLYKKREMKYLQKKVFFFFFVACAFFSFFLKFGDMQLPQAGQAADNKDSTVRVVLILVANIEAVNRLADLK
jgi:hypothetical protein